jgi:very-short-patch-repair endonuclease
MRNEPSTCGPELRVAQLAQSDHGVLTTAELVGCGLTRAGIHRRAKAGRLHRIHHRVYAVGHAALTPEAGWLAGVKACGPTAVLSHHSAAQMWDLLPRCPGPVHVTVPAHRHPRSVRGISVHRSKTLTAGDVTRRDRIPVTTPSRTLQDLKRVLPREQWEAVVDRARSRGRDVSDVVDEAPTRSVLERKFLRLCRRHRIQAPRVNVRVGRFLVDFVWPDSRLIVEVDGYEFHRDRASFESDRTRDAELALQGYRVLRFTYGQVTRERAWVAATVRQMMAS